MRLHHYGIGVVLAGLLLMLGVHGNVWALYHVVKAVIILGHH